MSLMGPSGLLKVSQHWRSNLQDYLLALRRKQTDKPTTFTYKLFLHLFIQMYMYFFYVLSLSLSLSACVLLQLLSGSSFQVELPHVQRKTDMQSDMQTQGKTDSVDALQFRSLFGDCWHMPPQH